jgi:phage shock protein A
MKTFKRLKNIINSNVNNTLDKMEDPEKMINLMITDLEDTLFKVGKSINSKKQEIIVLEKQIKDQLKREDRWLSRAKMAIQNNRDDLAKEALAEQKEAKSAIVEMTERIKSLDSILMNEDESLEQLNDKIKEIKAKKDALIHRAHHVAEKKWVKETLKEANSDDITKRFNEMEAKVEQMETEANIFKKKDDINDEFSKMELNAEIDNELSELKKAMASKEPKEDVQFKEEK